MSVRILIGDMRERLAEIEAESVDSAVTDPPYHLTSIVKRFGAANAAPAKVGKTGAYARASRGFMGQTWDGGDVAFDPETWAAVYRVLKPGAHLVAFGGTRTYHKLATAIENAGFEIRDMLCWHYGSGFPKSHNVKKGAGEAVCQCAADDDTLRGMREVSHGSGGLAASSEETDMLQALQRSSSRTGLGEARPQGSGGAQVAARHAAGEEPGLEGRRDAQETEGELQGRALREGAGGSETDGAGGRLHNGASPSDGSNVRLLVDAHRSGESPGSQPGEQSSEQLGTVADERGSQAWGGWPLCPGCLKPVVPEGLGTALKPATEPIVLARKPLVGTVAQNVLKHGTGAINIDGCRIEAEAPRRLIDATAKVNESGWGTYQGSRGVGETSLGRWPANIIHDGSEEVLAHFPDTESGVMRAGTRRAAQDEPGSVVYGVYGGNATSADTFGDSGSAARFFYTAKADSSERHDGCHDLEKGNNHPTVKPVDLMRYLCRLVTPKGGTVLDPFAGSGSTLIAADAEQFNAIGCELSPDYAAIAERRIKASAGLFAEVQAA